MKPLLKTEDHEADRTENILPDSVESQTWSAIRERKRRLKRSSIDSEKFNVLHCNADDFVLSALFKSYFINNLNHRPGVYVIILNCGNTYADWYISIRTTVKFGSSADLESFFSVLVGQKAVEQCSGQCFLLYSCSNRSIWR